MHTGIMNSVYLIRSILECVDHDLMCKQNEVKVCNLDPSTRTVVLVLSNLTSAAMLGYKAARNVCACLRWFALFCDYCLCCTAVAAVNSFVQRASCYESSGAM